MKVLKEFKGFLRKRRKDSHKGDYGHVFILAGSRGFTGAAALCAEATLRSGAGLATLGIPISLNPVMEAKLTEVMTCPLSETKEGTLSLKAKEEILDRVDDSDVVILGPGLSRNPETIKLVRQLIVSIKKVMVLDADALNAVSGDISILKKIKHRYILTPHPGEMARLLKRNLVYIKKNRLEVTRDFSNHYNKAIVVLKGSGTIVADKSARNRVYVNGSGNPGMATAGSGDVLTGVIGGFLSQGLEVFDAARLGVYIHGLAGDLAAKDKGEVALIAGDILEKIPEAIKLVT
ncbi:NAD(P)H-hydrate dehydratase [Candidatus Omnitrophota bacterium]